MTTCPVQSLVPQQPVDQFRSGLKAVGTATFKEGNRSVYSLYFPTSVADTGIVYYQDEIRITSVIKALIPTEPFEYTVDPSGAVLPIGNLLISRVSYRSAAAFVRVTGVLNMLKGFTPMVNVRCLPVNGTALQVERRCQLTVFKPGPLSALCANSGFCEEGDSPTQTDSDFELLDDAQTE